MKVVRQTLLIVILPLMLIGGINYTIDPDYTLRKTHIPHLTDELVKGNFVRGPVNINSRELKRQWIEKLPYQPNVLVLGSSRTIAISHKSFPDESFFNASVTNCTFQDMYSFVYLFENRWGRLPKNIIICVDQWLLGNTFAEKQWLVNRSYFVDMIKRTNCNNGLKIPSRWELDKEWIKELFSVKYLARSIKLRGKSEEFIVSETFETKIGSAFMPDGSRVLPNNIVNANENEVNRKAIEYFYSSNDERFNTLDPGQCQLLVCLINYLEGKGCKITLFIPPYHPQTYQLFQQSTETKGIFEVELFIKQNFKNQKIIGGTNPSELGLSTSDFYDGVHLKSKILELYFK